MNGAILQKRLGGHRFSRAADINPLTAATAKPLDEKPPAGGPPPAADFIMRGCLSPLIAANDAGCPMRVLGLETSCDETGVALYDSERGLLADALFSQIDLHRVYGGVVPELASRDHVKRMLPLIRQVLDEAGCQPPTIDAIAYTAGARPGRCASGRGLLRPGRWPWPGTCRRSA